MTLQELAADLRTRINPAYAATLGTESYERRLCAEAIELLMAEVERVHQMIHSCGPTCNKGGCMNRRLIEQAKADEALMRQALAALEWEYGGEPCGGQQAINALRKRLEQTK